MVDENRGNQENIALLYFGKKIKFKDLFYEINRTAAAFGELGVKEKDIVTVALPSIPEAVYVVYALNKIGAVANMIHPLAGREEIINYLNEVKSKVFVLFDGTYQIVKDSLNRTSVEKAVLVTPAESLPFATKLLYSFSNKKEQIPDDGIYVKWTDFIEGGSKWNYRKVTKNIYELALISHTGGTTGEPKGVMVSDYNVNALIYQITSCFDARKNGCCMSVLPPFVNYSLVESVLAMLAIGYKVVLIPSYKPEKFVLYVRKYRPNTILSIPPYWEALLKIRNIKKTDFSSFDQIYYGGEGMSAEKEETINEILRNHGSSKDLGKGLGSTEMVAGATQTYPQVNSSGSVGIPLIKTNCKIVNQGTTDELMINEEGEICFSGPTLMLGYYNNPEATEELIKTDADGTRWLHTGDIGYISENGEVFVTGRIKRICITRGEDGTAVKLFPDRIEKVLSAIDCVEECCVFEKEDEERVNVAIALVILKQGRAFEDEAEAINKELEEKLPSYMVPVAIKNVKELPRTSRGKMDYRKAKEMWGA